MVNLTSRDKRKPAAKNALIDTAFRATQRTGTKVTLMKISTLAVATQLDGRKSYLVTGSVLESTSRLSTEQYTALLREHGYTDGAIKNLRMKRRTVRFDTIGCFEATITVPKEQS
jgi:hypothetical protein